MAGLQTSSGHSAEDGEDEGGTADPAKENSSVMDTSDNSQSPRVGSKDTPRYESYVSVFYLLSRTSLSRTGVTKHVYGGPLRHALDTTS